MSDELEVRILAPRSRPAVYGPAPPGAILGCPPPDGRARCLRPPRRARADARRSALRSSIATSVTPGRAAARGHEAPRAAFSQVGEAILHDGVQRSPRAGWQHLHVAVDDHTRTRLLRDAGRPGGRALLRLPGAGRRLVRRRARHRASSACSPTTATPTARHAWRDLCAAARHRAPPHPALHAAHQRQSRGLHRHRPARVGATAGPYPTSAPPHPSPPRLGAVVQPTPPPQLPGRPAADQPCRTGRGQFS